MNAKNNKSNTALMEAHQFGNTDIVTLIKPRANYVLLPGSEYSGGKRKTKRKTRKTKKSNKRPKKHGRKTRKKNSGGRKLL